MTIKIASGNKDLREVQAALDLARLGIPANWEEAKCALSRLARLAQNDSGEKAA